MHCGGPVQVSGEWRRIQQGRRHKRCATVLLAGLPRACQCPHASQSCQASWHAVRLAVNGCVASIWIAYCTARNTSCIVGALSFPFVLATSVLIPLRLRSGHVPIESYRDRRIAESDAATQLETLVELMACERLHLDPGLTLSDSACCRSGCRSCSATTNRLRSSNTWRNCA